MDGRWGKVTARASAQSGLLTRRQAIAVGYGRREWDRKVRLGEVAPVHRGLYELSAAAPGAHRDLWTALLLAGPKSVLSHRAAARLANLWGIDGAPIELTAPWPRLETTAFTIHRGCVPPADQRLVSGLRVTTLERTILDLAGLLTVEQLAMALESVRRQSKQAIRNLEDAAPGVTLHRLLGDCNARPRPFDSPFEVMFWHRLPLTGLPRPTPQAPFNDAEGRCYIDFAWEAQKVAVETEGYETRQTRASFDADARRMSRLAAAGWLVIRVTYTQYMNEWEAVVDRIRRALTRR